MVTHTLDKIMEDAQTRARFESFLKDKGFRDNGISELETRLFEGRPITGDMYHVEDFMENGR